MKKGIHTDTYIHDLVHIDQDVECLDKPCSPRYGADKIVMSKLRKTPYQSL